MLDPGTLGLHFEPITIVNPTDREKLDAWLIPSIDARQVIEERNRVLSKTFPAVVLVHDYDANREQMLSFARPLHDAGFTVLLLGLRGTGQGVGGTSSPGQTFGIRESSDVRAAVDALRARPFIDDNRVAVLGVGTGANASILNFAYDARLAAAVLITPVPSARDAIAQHMLSDRISCKWLAPICRWTFELAYRVDADDLELSRHEQTIRTRPVMVINRAGAPGEVARIRNFLAQKLITKK